MPIRDNSTLPPVIKKPTLVSSEQLATFGRQHVAKGMGRLRDHTFVEGKGLRITVADGSKLLDFTSGIGVTNLGHCHPEVTAAACAQMSTFVHCQASMAFHLPYLQLIEKLLPVMPHPSLDTFFFWNSGSEAIEAALKLARKATGKNNIISMQGGYHGRTYGSGSLTRSKTIYMEGFGTGIGGVYCTPFPYWHSMGLSPETSEEELVRLASYQLDLLLLQQCAPSDTAAIIIEPFIGEGGYVQAPPAFLKKIREVCDRHNILMIVDEVQSGFGRTGKYFAIEHTPEIVPDIMVIAKGIANGLPLSGIVSRKELMDTQTVGSMGGTYAGNAVACAAGVACATIMAREDILGNVERRAAQLQACLKAVRLNPKTSKMVADIRGLGLMAALEFKSPTDKTQGVYDPAAPSKLATIVQNECMDNGLLILTTSAFEVIRFIPALTVTEEEMEEACQIFTAAMEKVAAMY